MRSLCLPNVQTGNDTETFWNWPRSKAKVLDQVHIFVLILTPPGTVQDQSVPLEISFLVRLESTAYKFHKWCASCCAYHKLSACWNASHYCLHAVKCVWLLYQLCLCLESTTSYFPLSSIPNRKNRAKSKQYCDTPTHYTQAHVHIHSGTNTHMYTHTHPNAHNKQHLFTCMFFMQTFPWLEEGNNR